MSISIPLYEFCFLYNNKKQLVLCWKTNKSLIFIAIAFLVNLNEDVLEIEGSPLFRSWIFLWLICIVWQLWSKLMEIFLLLAHVFIVCRHIPLELYRFFVLIFCWRKRCYISFWCQHNVDVKRCYIRFGVNKRLTLKDIRCRKKVLFFMSTHRWHNDFKRHELLHHYVSTFWLTYSDAITCVV